MVEKKSFRLRLAIHFWERRITQWLRDQGQEVNRKRIQRLMRLMGLEAVYPQRTTTLAASGHKVYPYLLRNVSIDHVNQVWSTDITYVPLRHGFIYLTAVMDWHSRYVLSWRLSNSLEMTFCVEALEEALSQGLPEIFNSDQGSQFTCAPQIECVSAPECTLFIPFFCRVNGVHFTHR